MAGELTKIRRTKMGATKPYYAVISTESATTYPTYSTPAEFSEFVSLTEALQYAEGSFYSNDRESESSKIFKRCDLTFGNKGLTYTVMKDVFGATLSAEDEIAIGAGNTPPRIGFGFYRTLEDNGKRYYEGVYYPICRAAIGSESDNTLGENITYAGEEISLVAYAMSDSAKTWKEMKIFETAAAAEAWVKEKLGATA